MLSILTKWFQKTKRPDGAPIVSTHCCPVHGDEPCDCAPVDSSRRRFIGALLGGTVGVATGMLVLPPRKTIVTMPVKIARVPNAYPVCRNSPLDRAYLRPMEQPLYDTEMFSTVGAEVTFFSRPENYYKKNLRLGHEKLVRKLVDEEISRAKKISDYVAGCKVLGDAEIAEIISSEKEFDAGGGKLLEHCMALFKS